MSAPIVFVCGATGVQGGAVARSLRAKDVEVHALARDPTSKKAKAIEAIGVKLWPGNYDNVEALRSAMERCTSVFINFMPDFHDIDAEKRHAKNIFTTAKNAGVQHVAYSGSLTSGAPQEMSYWDPKSLMATFILIKYDIEQQTRNAGFKYWTIFRPGNFMANYLIPLVRMYDPLTETGVWTTALRPDSQLPMVATKTIGEFAAAAFLDPERFNEQAIGYADELLCVDEMMEKLSQATGRELRAEYMSDEEAEKQKASNPFINGQLAMRDMVKFIDMDEVKTWDVPLSTFDEFLESEKDGLKETYHQPA